MGGEDYDMEFYKKRKKYDRKALDIVKFYAEAKPVSPSELSIYNLIKANSKKRKPVDPRVWQIIKNLLI